MSEEKKKLGRPPRKPETLKKKVNLTISTEAREGGDLVAYSRGLSLSALVEELLTKEHRRHERAS